MRVLVICPPVYNGDELWPALKTLAERGHEFVLCSLTPTIRQEGTKSKNRSSMVVSDLSYDPEEFDGIMITSGPMKWTEQYWNHPMVVSAIKRANALDQPLAAICGAVGSLWPAVEGKRVSFYPLIRVRQHLEAAGALLSPIGMTRDKNLVTGEHQAVSHMWANEFCNLLEGKPPEFVLYDSGFVPMGGERKPIPALEIARRNAKR